ncbi:putative flavin-containing monooxygenase [Gordonia effusa NBRC 100432]|uniref:Putative flavin-containing monooxygenase n=1 Tax=Gordonia effusa NBRC 100432 TaxID=1077974 RepID=H0R5N2_9ACTN|nr:NAD(P)/FAD-dependent oxidoreductase [Gordonia effusa]GAB20383.1 putative flavin-containing monooxygenase [Gordonia effusa NBRC 100432]
MIVPDHEVLIIGAGFGGIGAAIELDRAGISDYIIIDKNEGIGGTWWANTYPGVAVDIPSIYYSFSYAPPKKWSRVFAPGAEVQRYAEQVVDTFGLRDRIRLGVGAVAGNWDEDNHLWHVQLADGSTLTCRYAIGAVGALEQPQMPDIAGIEKYAGKVVHTSRWDHDFDYSSKRIAVIGTGATALQLIPELSDVAAHLTVFQRTPIWVAPKPDARIPGAVAGTLLRVPVIRRSIRAAVTVGIDFGITGIGLFHDRVPFLVSGLAKGGALGYRAWLRGEPDLAAQLTPDYAPGCKRPSVSNRYLKTFTLPHVDLVTSAITEITETGVRTADGRDHEIDVLVCATGFKVMAKGATPPFPLQGVGGLDLNQFWDENRFQAYQGVSVPKFPNSFLITGPYGFAAGSYIAMIECTSRHAARAIAESRRRGATRVEIRQEPHDAYYRKYRARAQKTMWLSDACEGSNTYYVNYQGDPAAIRPSTHIEMWWGNKHFPLDDYSYTTLVHVDAEQSDVDTSRTPKVSGVS